MAAATVIDIVIQWKVFLGRVDARVMQPALQENKDNKETRESNCSSEDTTDELTRRYPGCVFNYSRDSRRDDDGGFWFDFMADCGEYFERSKNNQRSLTARS